MISFTAGSSTNTTREGTDTAFTVSSNYATGETPAYSHNRSTPLQQALQDFSDALRAACPRTLRRPGQKGIPRDARKDHRQGYQGLVQSQRILVPQDTRFAVYATWFARFPCHRRRRPRVVHRNKEAKGYGRKMAGPHAKHAAGRRCPSVRCPIA